MALTALSPAKINLFLHVVGKRENGYHNLQSVFVKLAGLYDQISIEPSNRIECFVPGIEITDNIVLKIAHALKEKYHIAQGARITIDKKIPIGGGLGGGSSNAATAIKLLCKLWQIDLGLQELLDFGVKFGADIPFFINPARVALVEGIGEIITSLTLNKEIHLVLVNPGVPVNTQAAYVKGFREYSQTFQQLDNNAFIELIYKGKNDLEPNGISQQPVIEEVLKGLYSQNGCKVARMSGSGSTCFGIFENLHQAEKANAVLAKKWWTHSETIML